MSDDEMDTLGPDGQGSSSSRLAGTSAAATNIDRDRRAPRFSWTPAYEATFFRSLCDSVQLGLRENSSFKAEAWERAMQALQDAHGAHPAKSHLINKSDNARKRFRLWRGLREDPEFHYNPVARTVSASEEAWKAHIEREPLSRALRGRPFEHEDYMETLYPDVIGSGGAPKRVMKPRRRTDGTLVPDDSEMPGTGVLNLQQQQQQHQQVGSMLPSALMDGFPQTRPLLQQTPSGSSNESITSRRSGSSFPTMSVPTMANPAALTPPDEVGSSGRKRSFHSAQNAMDQGGSGDLLSTPGQLHAADKRRRTTHGLPTIQLPGSAAHNLSMSAHGGEVAAATAAAATATPRTDAETVEDFANVLRTWNAPQWREQALDIFFKDFADEDLDLQVKVSEGVLSVEGKAMVFCKMPVHVRQHWIRRLRETHHRPGQF